MNCHFNRHDSSVFNLYEINEKEIVSYSRDKTIRIWVVKTITCKGILRDNNDYICCSTKLKDNQFVCASDDKEIKVLEFDNAKKSTISGHSQKILC